MNAPLWVVELATTFWHEAGGPEPFPRQLRQPIDAVFALGIRAYPGLSTAVVRDWLHRRHIPFPLEAVDRPLRGCLIARDGGGWIFLDADDEAAEQRFSLAHELAHFLRHYWQPRRHACDRLGPPILEVFDGRRPPRPEERLHALLLGIPLGFHAHLMGRTLRTDAIGIAEEEADRLAYELLAPAETVAARLGEGGATVVALLRDYFGLPPRAADDYAGMLLPAPPVDPLLRWLKWQ